LREADQIFTVFTKDFGKIKILARAIRNIKSKLRSGADLFYLSELEFIQGKAYKTLTDAIALNKFKNIRKDLSKLEPVQQIADSLDILVHQEEKDKQIWNLLIETLEKYWDRPGLSPIVGIDRDYPHYFNLVYYYFLWNLFSILGYQIDLHHCVACQKKLSLSKLYFSPDQGGIVCSDCSDRAKEKTEVSPNAIKILRILLKKDWDTLSKLKIQDSEKKYLETISELNLKSLASFVG
jgi:DNA repair protein RecO (recombination protein O)